MDSKDARDKNDDTGYTLVPSATGFAAQQIQRLVVAKLAGRKIDGVAFVDELLALAQRTGEVRCGLAGDHGLRFEFRGQEPFEIDLDAGRGKLRILCARLATLCQEHGHDFRPYGGAGTIQTARPAGHGTAGAWKVHWTNTPDAQDFTIQYQPE